MAAAKEQYKQALPDTLATCHPIEPTKSICGGTLSDGNAASDETTDGHFEFVMHSELVEALEEMRWVKPIS